MQILFKIFVQTMRTNHALCVINTVKKYLLRAGWSVDRISLGFDFPHPSGPALGPPIVQYNRYQEPMGAWSWPTPPPSSSEVKERVALYLYSSSGPSWPVLERSFLYLNNLEQTRTSNWKFFFTVSGVFLDNGIVTSTKLLRLRY